MTFCNSKLVVVTCTLYAVLSGCASIDFDYPRIESTAPTDTADTAIGKQLARTIEANPENQSGFYALPNGIDALTARLLLAAKAERTIDTQYYLIKNDITGRAFINALLEAADRGVRVRLLVDDIFTKGYDAGMAALDSHPNFEIRIFNPFLRGFGGKAWSSVTNMSRINRRMHTKSFTVDNQVTIVGGRNIADEYFGARQDAKFGDLDVGGIGPVAREVSGMFDIFWNHKTALPVPAFAEMPKDTVAELERVRNILEMARAQIDDSPYAAAVRQKALEFLDNSADTFEWSPYRLVYDHPDKGIKASAKADGFVSITKSLIDSLASAQKELIVVSPYFVPLKSGVEGFSEIQHRGVDVTIITNSLAANNHASVHGGYAPSRKPLLRNGVKIYEVRPDADIVGSEITAAFDARATLHTKAFIVDRREVFIGSFNFDPRSANLNTESGVIIQSPQLAERFAKRVVDSLSDQTYEVFLNDRGSLRWRTHDDGEEKIYTKEPMATWSQRFTAAFVRILPAHSQL